MAIRLLMEYISFGAATQRSDMCHLTLCAIITYMLNSINARPWSGSAEKEILALCCQKVYADVDEDDSDYDGGELVPVLYSKGLYNLSAIVMGQHQARITFLTEASEHTLCFFFRAPTVEAIQMNFRHRTNNTRKRGPPIPIAPRTANKRPHTREVATTEFPAEGRPNFELLAAGVTLPPARIFRGPDVDAARVAGLIIPPTEQISVDEFIVTQWYQCLSDVICKAPNPLNPRLGSHLILDLEKQFAVTDSLFQSTDFTEVFERCQYRRVATATWNTHIFDRIFPPKDAHFPAVFQNYRSCTYWGKWVDFMERLTPYAAHIVREKVRERFNKLHWFADAECDRIWSTRVDERRWTYIPDDEQPRRGCPHIALNPSMYPAEPKIVSAKTRVRKAVQEARIADAVKEMLREEEEEDEFGH